MASDSVTLTLSKNEAIVLFEWLAAAAIDDAGTPFRCPAEEIAVFRIQGQLESALTEPFLTSDRYLIPNRD